MEPWVIPVIIFSVFLCIMLLFAALSRCASVGSSNIGGGGAAAGHHRFGRDHLQDIGFSIGGMAVDTSIIVVAISAEKDDVGYHVGGGGIASGR
ncbi:hypothetical protein GOBAR_DD03533 [Gossypium barbadense]|nr:hypothetical protein GOBAR_DD03533 [Gossypium barbadense]